MRKGVDADHLTYLEAGRIAEAEGAAAVALHARTAADFYSGTADWPAIARLKEVVTEHPGARQRRHLVGRRRARGWSRRPGATASSWAGAAWAGRGCSPISPPPSRAGPSAVRPGLGDVLATLRRHLVLLVEHYAAAYPGDAEHRACRDIRKHIAWYLKGYHVGSQARAQLALVESLAGFDALVEQLDGAQPYPGAPAEGPRGRAGTPRSVALPDGWLDSRELDLAGVAELHEAELSVSGG